jgi:hypothetical protein
MSVSSPLLICLRERRRRFLSLIIIASTKTSLNLSSTLLKTLNQCGVFEKRGLCSGGLLFRRRSGGGSTQHFQRLWLNKVSPKSEGCALQAFRQLAERFGGGLQHQRRHRMRQSRHFGSLSSYPQTIRNFFIPTVHDYYSYFSIFIYESRC